MISVCIATYNGESFIKEQLDSILSQLGENDEIIISDDNSSDNTVSIINSYGDTRIKLFKHEKEHKMNHVGEIVSANFNNAILKAKGDYIFLSDQDDIWCDNKISTMKQYLDKYDVVASNAWLYDGTTKDCNETLYKSHSPLRNYGLRKYKYYGCTMAMTKDAAKYILPIPKGLALYDSWIGLVGELVNGAFYINKPLIYYRLRTESVSHSIKNSLFYMMKYRLWFYINLIVRVANVRFISRNKYKSK